MKTCIFHGLLLCYLRGQFDTIPSLSTNLSQIRSSHRFSFSFSYCSDASRLYFFWDWNLWMSRENMFFSQIEATTDMKNKRKRLANKAMEANLVYFGQKKLQRKCVPKSSEWNISKRKSQIRKIRILKYFIKKFVKLK